MDHSFQTLEVPGRINIAIAIGANNAKKITKICRSTITIKPRPTATTATSPKVKVAISPRLEIAAIPKIAAAELAVPATFALTCIPPEAVKFLKG